jgi:hypothetical protein
VLEAQYVLPGTSGYTRNVFILSLNAFIICIKDKKQAEIKHQSDFIKFHKGKEFEEKDKVDIKCKVL